MIFSKKHGYSRFDEIRSSIPIVLDEQGLEVTNNDDFIIRFGEPKGTSPCYVDPKGYIPLRKQIERGIDAGERLRAYRRGEYDSLTNDFYDGEPSGILDPDFMPSTDVGAIQESINEKYKSQQSTTSPEKGAEQIKNVRATGSEESGVSGENLLSENN